MRAFLFPIELPNPPRHRNHPPYSHQLGKLLAEQYVAIEDTEVAGKRCQHALDLLTPWLDADICGEQRMRVHFILGKARAGLDDFDAAVHHYTHALTIASGTSAVLDMALILSLRAMAHRRVGRVDDAVNDFTESLLHFDSGLQDLGLSGSTPAAVAFKLDIHALLACFLPFAGRYALAQQFINKGRELVPFAPHARLNAATLEWGQCLVYRAQKSHWEAWHCAVNAAETYLEAGSARNAGRVQTLAAETALDLAQQISIDRRFWLAEARRRVKLGCALAEEASDENGAVMNRLALVRLDRVRRHLSTRKRVDMLIQIANDAQRMGDDALRSQAFIAIGDEMAATRRYAHRAAIWYRQAVGALDGSQIPGLVNSARREIWLASEMRA